MQRFYFTYCHKGEATHSNMKKYFFILVFLFSMVFFGCKKGHSFESNATLIGYDMRECPCCGGLEITIDNVKPPDGWSFFLVNELPPDFKLGDNPHFPIKVSIDYSIDTIHCFKNMVNISRIQRR